MKNTKSCPKCGSTDIVRIPDNPNRHASGNNIYTSTYTLFGKIPVIRYVCCSCGYAENWVENEEELEEIREIQELNKERIGYYGSFAKCRSLSIDEAIKKIKSGEEYVVRLKSPGNFNKKSLS